MDKPLTRTEQSKLLSVISSNLFSDVSNIVIAYFYDEKELKNQGTPFPIFMESDPLRYTSKDLINSADEIDDHVFQQEHDRAVQYCQDNFIPHDYNFINKISKEVKISKNKAIIYWEGENQPPEFYFESSANNGKNILYVFSSLDENRQYINSIHLPKTNTENAAQYKNAKEEEAIIVLCDIKNRDIELYHGDDCVTVFSH